MSLLLMVLGGNHSGTSESGLSRPSRRLYKVGPILLLSDCMDLPNKAPHMLEWFCKGCTSLFPSRDPQAAKAIPGRTERLGGGRERETPSGVGGNTRFALQKIGQTLCSCRAGSSPAQELSSQ